MNQAVSQTTSPSSTEQSPCEIKALQDEYRQLNQETRISTDSSSSGYHSPQFLQPPVTPMSLTPGKPKELPRRLSESCVIPNQTNFQGESTVSSKEDAKNDELMAAMYEEMYSKSSGRRFSYPNSPTHNGLVDGEKGQSTVKNICRFSRIVEYFVQ